MGRLTYYLKEKELRLWSWRRRNNKENEVLSNENIINIIILISKGSKVNKIL